ncbi:uncharacterized protein LOC119273636 [Triticum dicoccoides]|uniref:uncharacterized protein LOC119273636 n=1 Tax=Triticum dicoccoides TaxID=85692 RepID=UPI001890AEB6|nr:uncharacterized protein LOC119273636 [Triticum dicoccoides]
MAWQLIALLPVALVAAAAVAAAGAGLPSNFAMITPRGPILGKRDAGEYCGKRKCMAKCESRCPDQCFVLCPSCKTLCMCDYYPGISCGDPRFTGGDGNNFYFHGKKDQDFCVVSDADLHVNAHFIGMHNPATDRNFTWIQAIGMRFVDHRLFVGAKKTVKWNNRVDHLEMALDDETIDLPAKLDARWESAAVAGLTITRTATTNGIRVQLKGVFDIMASVVPVTEKDSRIHNYGVTEEDSLAHLDIGFKFHDLTDDVHGVLGQTYRSDYINKLRVSASMPVMGGITSYVSSDIFATDCAVARFGRRTSISMVASSDS